MATLRLLSDPNFTRELASIDAPLFFCITSNAITEIENINLIPKPVSDELNIKGLFPKESRYAIFNVGGKSLGDHQKIDCLLPFRHLPKGLSFLKIESQNQNWTSRFINDE